jgi:hypothetical protein
MRQSARHAAAIAAIACALAGCGSLHAPASLSGPSSRPAAARGSTPAAGSRAQALALARQMLARLVLPAGARPAVPRHQPQPLSRAQLGPMTSVDLHKMFTAALPMRTVAQYLITHPPAGMKLTGTGREGQGRSGTGHPPKLEPATTIAESLSYQPRALPRWVYSAELDITMTPAGNGSLLRADAEVTWYPPRTAAEYLDPSGYRAVLVSLSVAGRDPLPRPRLVTSRAAVERLARLLDSLPAAPEVAFVSCPMITATYWFRFEPRGHRGRPAVVLAGGCFTDVITVNGRRQPPLWDPANRLLKAAARLFRMDVPRLP